MEYQGRQKNNKDTFTKTANPVQNDTSAQLAKNPSGGNQMQQLQSQANSSGLVGGLTQLQSIADQHTDSKAPIQRKENTTGLPDQLKSGVENLSGMSLDDVKVHRNSDKPAQLNAHAYAQGTDIHLGPGQEKHLPHEAWHVVQQKEGRVKPTKQMKGKVNVNDDAGLEKEADIMGQKALQMHQMDNEENPKQLISQNFDSIQLTASGNVNSTIQREVDGGDNETINPLAAEAMDGETANEQVANGNQNNHILKFNFAGSGEEQWKTHKGKYKSSGKDFGERQDDFAGKKWKKEKETIGGHKTVYEYAGPHTKLVSLFGKGFGKGITDEGANSTEKNFENAKQMMRIFALNNLSHAGDQTVRVDIKGFSRGAATATVFANWIKENYPSISVNLVAIDPVHGTGNWDNSNVFSRIGQSRMAKMEERQDLSAIDNSTYVLPITSKHGRMSFGKFRPQLVSNYSRIIIIYGANVKHSMGLGGETKTTLTYRGEPIKGTQLGTLPPGLFVADSTDYSGGNDKTPSGKPTIKIPIVQIKTVAEWEGVSPRITGGGYIKRDKRNWIKRKLGIGKKIKNDKKVKKNEGRDQIISAAFDQFVQSGHVEREMIENPMLAGR